MLFEADLSDDVQDGPTKSSFYWEMLKGGLLSFGGIDVELRITLLGNIVSIILLYRPNIMPIRKNSIKNYNNSNQNA